MTDPLTYRRAGVDVGAAEALMATIAAVARSTHGPEVEPGPGAYAGLYRIPGGPLLAATSDGVGTKLLVARELGLYEGIGRDLVAMNLNDLVAVGARPLFFLDYIAVGRLEGSAVEPIIRGAAAACAEAGCALLGGETAEMPGVYEADGFDVAGFAVGALADDLRPDATRLGAGDVVLGLPSNGIHANGFSLARAALGRSGLGLGDLLPGSAQSIGEDLLRPTPLYVGRVPPAPPEHRPRALVHVTGGGLSGRGTAALADGLRMHLETDRYPKPPIFDLIQVAGSVSPQEMAATFNLGLGFLAIVAAASVRWWMDRAAGWIEVGRVAEGERGVELHA